MKMKFKEISIIFSLLFILLISLAVVSAEEISDSENLSLYDNSESIDNDYENDFNLEAVESDSASQVSDLNEENSNLVGASSPETDISQVSDEILSQNQESSNIISAESNGYSISVKNISANEGTTVNIVANVYKDNNPVSGGYVLFGLWTANGNPVAGNASISNGQAVLNITLPKTSELSAYNWICLAEYFDENTEYQTNASFLVQIKKIYSTKILASNILGKMGKKVTLVAYVYDDDGYKVNVGTVTFTVNGKSYKVAVKNGKASKTITSPFVGIYNVKVAYKGVDNYKSSKGSFKLGSDLRIKTVYYKTMSVKKGAKKYFKMTLTNYFTNKRLKYFKMKLKVKINKKTWKTYTVKSNSKGIIKWSTKKLARGTHSVKIKSAYKNFSFNLKSKIIVR